ncbi:MAG: GNAT family N-acetyltransferase [Bacteroidetes bacterium CG12_big_fil_rev_8_21_14_0_65_60_17]|nr:MAG: GNAT family N-acetyltransferase [Bacteroidetes bacterium CG12_big_fil_rev_8_21_14_0_65_60_17]
MESFDYTPVRTIPARNASRLRIEAVGPERLDVIRTMNRSIFREERIINTFERDDLVMLLAWHDDTPVGFKVGYRENRFIFYSAKGGVIPSFRRQGVATALLSEMAECATGMGYRRFAFDTFPNLHPGMTIMALKSGFRLIKSDYNTVYREYRLRFEMALDS